MNQTDNIQKAYSVDIITERRLKKMEEIKVSHQRIISITQDLFAPPKSKNKMDNMLNNINAGIAAYDGVMTGVKIFKKIRLFFTKKK